MSSTTNTTARKPMRVFPIGLLIVLAYFGTSYGKRWLDARSVSAASAWQVTTTSPNSPDSQANGHVPDASSDSATDVDRDDSENDDSRQHGDLIGFGFEMAATVGRGLSEGADAAAGLSPAEERDIGRETHLQVARGNKCVSSGPQVEWITKLAQPFLKSRADQGRGYRFFVVEQDSINAFAHLGGYVYVHTGLLKQIRTDEELIFVIGHEIAHCELRHSAKNLVLATRAGKMLGSKNATALASMAWQLVARGYSEDFEFESDRWSYEQMRQQGVSHDRCLLGLKMLEQARHDSRRDRSRTDDRSLLQHLGDHFRTHPETSDRISRLERLKRTFK